MIDALKNLAKRIAYSPAGAIWMQRYGEWQAAQERGETPTVDADGVPIPSAFLITMVSGDIPWEAFLQSGELAIKTFADAVDRNGGDFARAGRVLDMGCGCGRLARHAPKLTDAAYFGVDYNARLVDWCAANLRGTFMRNGLRPPLKFVDGYFDVVYLLSVFTHLRIETQNAWLKELHRVVAPGGYCLVTFHDEDHPNIGLTDIDREDLLRKETIVFNDKAEGSNFISTFQTREYTQKQFGEWFEVREIIHSPDNDIKQAIAVLRKPV